MSSNENMVVAHYKDLREKRRAAASKYSELEFHYTKKHVSEFITSTSSVIELGCGTGYYAMYFSDKCKEYIGVDITPENISLLNKNIKARNLKNVIGKVGNATKLDDILDNRFDVVLCFGPLYHLPPVEQELVFAECNRICKKGGIAAFAYINRIGVYAGACVHDKLRENYPNEKANEIVLKLSVDNIRPELFFFTMPEEIETLAQTYGFSKIKNLGTDFFLTASVIDTMDNEKFEIMKPLLDEMASYTSCTGMSNHAVLVCQKI